MMSRRCLFASGTIPFVALADRVGGTMIEPKERRRAYHVFDGPDRRKDTKLDQMQQKDRRGLLLQLSNREQ